MKEMKGEKTTGVQRHDGDKVSHGGDKNRMKLAEDWRNGGSGQMRTRVLARWSWEEATKATRRRALTWWWTRTVVSCERYKKKQEGTRVSILSN